MYSEILKHMNVKLSRRIWLILRNEIFFSCYPEQGLVLHVLRSAKLRLILISLYSQQKQMMWLTRGISQHVWRSSASSGSVLVIISL